MRALVWIIVGALLVLHQDFWLWDSQTLVFGFLPSGLAYHAAFSVAAAATWALAVRFAWPSELERWADEFDGEDSAAAGREEPR